MLLSYKYRSILKLLYMELDTGIERLWQVPVHFSLTENNLTNIEMGEEKTTGKYFKECLNRDMNGGLYWESEILKNIPFIKKKFQASSASTGGAGECNIATFYRALWRETYFMNAFCCILRFWSKRHSILSTVYLLSLDFHGLLSWLTSKAAPLLQQRAFGSKTVSWIWRKRWKSECTGLEILCSHVVYFVAEYFLK